MNSMSSGFLARGSMLSEKLGSSWQAAEVLEDGVGVEARWLFVPAASFLAGNMYERKSIVI